jgi:chorismate mutase
VDDRLLELIHIRVQLSQKIKKVKTNYPIEDMKRENEILNRLYKRSPDLEKEFVQDLWTVLFNESKKIQELP